MDEWELHPERSDNHWFDCLVGCAVAVSMQGAVLMGTELTPRPKRARLKLLQSRRKRR